jgi:hypothetical protein
LDDGGSDITSYAVERRRSKGAAGNWAIVATVADPRTFLREDPPSSPSSPTSSAPPPLTSVAHTVSQLSPGEAYQFRIIASNKRGV